MLERVNTISSTSNLNAEHPMYAQMEATQEKVNPFLEMLPPVDTDPVLDNATSDTYEEILDLADEIRAAKGMAPLERGSTIRSLHALLVRIAELTEKHIFQRKEKDYKKKEEIKGKNKEISNWTRRQGHANFAAGILYPVAALLGASIGEPWAGNIRAAKDVFSGGTRALETWFESLKKNPEFEQSLYVQTASSEKQSLEGLKNMPRELQQKLQQILRQELEAIRATGQR